MSKKAENKEEDKGLPVVVITDFKEIFFGYTESKPDADIIILKHGRQVIYYSKDTQGLVGLASIGPGKDSRISPACPQIVIRKPVNVLVVNESAIAKFSSVVWK